MPTQPTVRHVDIQKYMGEWRVIASIPTSFEKGAHNAVEAYTWNSAKKQVDIDFRYNKDSFDGEEKHIPQRGWIYNEKTNAEWRIRPFWPLSFAYLIIDLADDYSDVVVGVPNRAHVWIMARSKQMKPERYSQLVAKIKSLGYDVSKLQLVPQK